MSQLTGPDEKCAKDCSSIEQSFESIWDKYIESVKTLDPSRTIDPGIVEESMKIALAIKNSALGAAPTNQKIVSTAPLTEVLKSPSKVLRQPRKFGMEKILREKKIDISDLLALPVSNIGWWSGLCNNGDENNLIDEVEIMEVTEESEEISEPKEINIFEDFTPEDRTLGEEPNKDKDFYLNLSNLKFSWFGGFGKSGTDKPILPRKIPKIYWPDYDRPPHLQNDPSYVPNKTSSHSKISHPRQVRKNKNRPPKRERERLAALAEASRLAAGDFPVTRPKGPAMTPKGSKPPRLSQLESPIKNPKAHQSIKVQIINESHAEDKLSDQEFAFIMDLLLQKWDKFPANSNFVPKFNGHGCDKGIGWILCADESTCNWTLQTILDIGQQMEPHVKIRANTANDLVPGLNLAKVEVPFVVGNTTALVFDRLTRANKGLNTSKWVIKKADPPTDKAWNIVLNIDDASVDFLRKLDFQPFYGLGRVTFKIDARKKYTNNKPRFTQSYQSSLKRSQPSQNSNRASQSNRYAPVQRGDNRSRNSNNNSRNNDLKRSSNGPRSLDRPSPWAKPYGNQRPNMQSTSTVWNHLMLNQASGILDNCNGGYSDNERFSDKRFSSNGGFSGNEGIPGNGGFSGNEGFASNGGFSGNRGYSGNGGYSSNGNQNFRNERLSSNDFDTFNQMMGMQGRNRDSRDIMRNSRNSRDMMQSRNNFY